MTYVEINNVWLNPTDHDSGQPGVHEGDGEDQKGSGQHTQEGQHQVEPQVDVLLPVGERVAAGVVGQPTVHELIAHCTEVLWDKETHLTVWVAIMDTARSNT